MDGLGYCHLQLFHMDLYGYQRWRHSKSINGGYVFVIGIKSNLELDSIMGTKHAKKRFFIVNYIQKPDKQFDEVVELCKKSIGAGKEANGKEADYTRRFLQKASAQEGCDYYHYCDCRAGGKQVRKAGEKGSQPGHHSGRPPKIACGEDPKISGE